MTEQHPTQATDRAQWFAIAMKGVVKLAASGKRFTAFDLVTICRVPEPPHPNCWGVLLGIAHADGLIVSVGAVPSSRPRTCKSLVRLWIGAAHAQDAVAS